jgi:hypothetical protein
MSKEGQMKYISIRRKPISMFVMLTFVVLLCFWANPSPAAPAAEKSTTASAAGGDENSPGFVETEASPPPAKHGKKIPWLVIGAVVVIGAAAVYFLVLKKSKYELTVTLGQGCTGTPAASAKYKKGAVVPYSYTPDSGYGNLQVKLDGAAVAASGSVTMDQAHSLEVSATYGAIVNITSSPAGAKIYDNNVDSGKTTPASFNYTAAGSHTYLLRQCGYQDYTKTQSVVVGQTYDINAVMPQGILDNFVLASSCWSPYNSSLWTTAGGYYKALSHNQKWDYSYYKISLGSSNYTVEVKMKRVKGSKYSSNSIVLATTTGHIGLNGYLFNYSVDGYYSVWKETNQNWITYSGGETQIKGWTFASIINRVMNNWNTLKIVRSGSSYSYYINGQLLTSFTDSTFDPRVVFLTFYAGNVDTEVHYDYAKASIGATLGLMPPDAASPCAVTDQKGSHHQ